MLRQIEGIDYGICSFVGRTNICTFLLYCLSDCRATRRLYNWNAFSPAGHDAASCRGAHTAASVELLEPDAISGHFVQLR